MPHAPLGRHAMAPTPVHPPRGHARSRRLLALLVSAGLVLTGLAVTGVVATPAATATETGMLSQVNGARADKGLQPYRWNAHLAAVADEQARRMARQATLFHNPDLARDVGAFRRVGENVGYGASSSSVQDALMKSSGHRANILGAYTQIGIAQVRDATGRLWVAQVFRAPSGSASSSGKQLRTVKKSAAAKRKPAVRKPVAVKPKAAAKPKAPARQQPPAAPPRTTPAAPLDTWALFSQVLALASAIATVSRGFAAPVALE